MRRFQSTRPRGARRRGLSRSTASSCFNPRARAGRDGRLAYMQTFLDHVSIHAPARRDRVIAAIKYEGVASTTRPRGATHPREPQAAPVQFTPSGPRESVSHHPHHRWFQFTRCAGRDLLRLITPIHMFNPRARAGRDTPASTPWKHCFNPRARAGRDPAGSVFRLRLVSITRPRGADVPALPAWLSRCFNPRARAGRAPPLHASRREMFHPRARAGRVRRCGGTVDLVSITRRAREGFETNISSEFQSTRPAGRDFTLSYRHTSFQSTRPRGARLPAGASTTSRCCFNPRARAGRDCNK